jgi:ABC-type transporter Mla MlaB component
MNRMIYIRERFLNKESVLIEVDGVLDRESIPALQEVLLCHLEDNKKTSVNLTKLLHISREGKAFLQEFTNKVILICDGQM